MDMDTEALIFELQSEQNRVRIQLSNTTYSGTPTIRRLNGELDGLQLAIDEAVKESDQSLRIRLKKSLAEWRKKCKETATSKFRYRGIVNAYETAVYETIQLEKEDSK